MLYNVSVGHWALFFSFWRTASWTFQVTRMHLIPSSHLFFTWFLFKMPRLRQLKCTSINQYKIYKMIMMFVTVYVWILYTNKKLNGSLQEEKFEVLVLRTLCLNSQDDSCKNIELHLKHLHTVQWNWWTSKTQIKWSCYTKFTLFYCKNLLHHVIAADK